MNCYICGTELELMDEKPFEISDFKGEIYKCPNCGAIHVVPACSEDGMCENCGCNVDIVDTSKKSVIFGGVPYTEEGQILIDNLSKELSECQHNLNETDGEERVQYIIQRKELDKTFRDTMASSIDESQNNDVVLYECHCGRCDCSHYLVKPLDSEKSQYDYYKNTDEDSQN